MFLFNTKFWRPDVESGCSVCHPVMVPKGSPKKAQMEWVTTVTSLHSLRLCCQKRRLHPFGPTVGLLDRLLQHFTGVFC